MKKRSILTIVLAIALTAIVSVGATMAYLTATDKEVVNTFKFADKMEVKVSETTPETEEDEKISSDPTGLKYENIVPGQKLNKSPKITTTTDVPAYVFVKVSSASAEVHPTLINGGWTAVADGTKDTNWNGVYWKYIDPAAQKGDLGYAARVSGQDGWYDLGSIFDQVEVSATPEVKKTVEYEKDGDGNVIGVKTSEGAEVKLQPIKIGVYEIQATTFIEKPADGSALTEAIIKTGAEKAYNDQVSDAQWGIAPVSAA